MRLPTSWTRKEKKEKVLEVVHFLEVSIHSFKIKSYFFFRNDINYHFLIKNKC